MQVLAGVLSWAQMPKALAGSTAKTMYRSLLKQAPTPWTWTEAKGDSFKIAIFLSQCALPSRCSQLLVLMQCSFSLRMIGAEGPNLLACCNLHHCANCKCLTWRSRRLGCAPASWFSGTATELSFMLWVSAVQLN